MAVLLHNKTSELPSDNTNLAQTEEKTPPSRLSHFSLLPCRLFPRKRPSDEEDDRSHSHHDGLMFVISTERHNKAAAVGSGIARPVN